jgi:uncharacterized heparinase superfamily protein
MTSVGTYWRTLRHLRARQILGRLRFRLGAPVPSSGPAPLLRDRIGVWILPARREQSLFPDFRLRFLNEEHALNEIGWDRLSVSKLWRYNLHYFDDLNAAGSDDRRDPSAEMIGHWIAQNPPVRGTGWEPYPTSLRIVNWIKWFQRGNAAKPAWLDSLALQVRWLTRRLEWHLLGNHLFVNGKALFVAGCFFQGVEADRWRRIGAAILRREIGEQVLKDGGQFERTPMYHLLALEDVLDLLSCLQCFGTLDSECAALRDQLRERAVHMMSWATLMRFESGAMPRLNDTAEGVAPAFAELCRVADALDLPKPNVDWCPIELLTATGYARLAWGNALAFVDVAPVGPAYLPGHAHADTLSFELEVSGQQLVVNRGTSCYGVSERRAYERSTAAHSTVEVAKCSSSETWSGFRVGRRAYPRDLHVHESGISCAHDGYRFLPGRPVHRRTWTMHTRALQIDDAVTGNVAAIARYHLAPGLDATLVTPGRWSIQRDGAEVAQLLISVGTGALTSTEHALAFGRLTVARTVEIALESGRASTCWSW